MTSGSRTTFTTDVLSVVGSGFCSRQMAFTLVRCLTVLAASDLFAGLFWSPCKIFSCPSGHIWWLGGNLSVSFIGRRGTCFLAFLARRRPIRLVWRLLVIQPVSSGRFWWRWRLLFCFLDCFWWRVSSRVILHLQRGF